jgi:hypothetical protein
MMLILGHMAAITAPIRFWNTLPEEASNKSMT